MQANTKPKHMFIHPTKTGGTAIEQYFAKHYKAAIGGEGHLNDCSKTPNPIIVIREPMERFVSMFTYWCNGATSGRFVRTVNWRPPCRSISKFISILKSDDRKFLNAHVFKNWITRLHFSPQEHWIKPQHYEKAIVIRYCKKDLITKIKKVLEYVGVPDKDIPLPQVNVTKQKDGIDLTMTEQDVAWIRERYESDFELWELLQGAPERFRLVV